MTKEVCAKMKGVASNLNVAMNEPVAVEVHEAQHNLRCDRAHLRFRKGTEVRLARSREEVSSPEGLRNEVNAGR